MLQKMRGNNKGFTLIELMIVIAIIGILAAIAIPNFIEYRNKAYCSRAENDAQSVMAALSSYFSEPENTSMPSVPELRSAEELTLNPDNAATTQDLGSNVYQVDVFDGTTKCPRGTVYTAYFGTSTAGAWQ